MNTREALREAQRLSDMLETVLIYANDNAPNNHAKDALYKAGREMASQLKTLMANFNLSNDENLAVYDEIPF